MRVTSVARCVSSRQPPSCSAQSRAPPSRPTTTSAGGPSCATGDAGDRTIRRGPRTSSRRRKCRAPRSSSAAASSSRWRAPCRSRRRPTSGPIRSSAGRPTRSAPNSTTDTYQVSYHGLSLGHTDAFCHFFMDGQMYNGYSVKENISPESGCKQGSIMGRRDGIVTRGVLYDMPQMKGVEWIEPGTPITRADLEAWEKKIRRARRPGRRHRAVRRPMEAPGQDGAVVGPGRRLLRRHDPVLQGARYLIRRRTT